MTGRLVVASANAHKAAELQDLLVSLGIGLDVVARPADLAVPAEDAPDFIGNARIKAAAVAAATGEWALADDSGLEVDALDGAPGVRSARFAGDEASDADNVALLLDRLVGLGAVTAAERRARFRCCIVVQSPPDADGSVIELVADGTVEGHIAGAPRGTAASATTRCSYPTTRSAMPRPRGGPSPRCRGSRRHPSATGAGRCGPSPRSSPACPELRRSSHQPRRSTGHTSMTSSPRTRCRRSW